MFAMSIYDTLTPGSLTDGQVVAGTGTISRRRQGRRDRRHPAEDRRRPAGRRPAVPGAALQLRRRARRRQRLDAAGQGGRPCKARSPRSRPGGRPRRPAAVVRAASTGGDVMTARHEPERGARGRRARDRAARGRGRLGPAGPAVRPGRDRRARRPASRSWPPASATRPSPRSSRRDWRPGGRSRTSWRRSPGPRRCTAARPWSSGSCCRPTSRPSCPTTPAAAAAYASEHPDRQEVRIVAAATRTGASYCALRLRAHDEDDLGADRARTSCRRAGATWVRRHASTEETRDERPAGAGVRRLPAAPLAPGADPAVRRRSA